MDASYEYRPTGYRSKVGLLYTKTTHLGLSINDCQLCMIKAYRADLQGRPIITIFLGLRIIWVTCNEIDFYDISYMPIKVQGSSNTLYDLLLKVLRFKFMSMEFQQSFDILQLQISINHQSIELSKLILRSLDSLLQKIQLLLRIYFIFNFKCQISIFYSFHKP